MVQVKSTSNSTEPFTCPICQKVFSKRTLLKSHLGSVHVGKNYQCNICSKTFTSSENFRFHKMNVHDHEKEKDKFECNQCGKQFYRRILLKLHSQVHSKERIRYGCDICEKTYFHESHLKDHISSIHNRSTYCPGLLCVRKLTPFYANTSGTRESI